MPRRLADMTYVEVEELLASGAPVVAILPVGATEAHGPHLPISTDVIISEAFGWQAGDLIEALGGAKAVMLPPLSYSPADYASGFAGTIGIRWETMGAMLRDVGLALRTQGFACLAIANSHFDPANVNVLRGAAKEIAATGLPVAYADATRRKLAAMLTEEFQTGDCHAGQFEGSIVLAARPDLVKLEVMQELEPVNAGLIAAMQAKAEAVSNGDSQDRGVRFEDTGMVQAYCGAPAKATAQEGNQSIATLARALADAVREALAGD